MYAHDVSFHLKSNMFADYTRAFDKDILPLLRKQNGFEDEITFSGPGGVDVNAISLWDNKGSADTYNTNSYPEVLKTMTRFIQGTPTVHTSEVVNSTFHKIAAGSITDRIRNLDNGTEEVRLEKIEKLRAAIADKTYYVSASDVARKFIDHMQQP
jgi:anti-sigma28 factor (negative regulator of flagellin synthesis)